MITDKTILAALDAWKSGDREESERLFASHSSISNDSFRRAIEEGMARLAHETLVPSRVFHFVWEEDDGCLLVTLCDGTGTHTAERFDRENQALPLTAYAEHIVSDTIGELERRPWYIEPPPCQRCAAASEVHR